MAEQPVVRVGQAWADNNRHEGGRTLRVVEIEGGVASCIVVTNADRVQRALDRGDDDFRDRRGATVRIRVGRFRPTSTGYRLVKDASDG